MPMKGAELFYAGSEEPHFLEACSLCSKPLGHNSDIFMYRGNTPYCSQECRQEQIEVDEAIEKRWKVTSSKRSTTSLRQENDKSTPSKSVRTTSTVAVA